MKDKLINSTLATRSERGTRGGQKRKYYLDMRVRLAVRSERYGVSLRITSRSLRQKP
jgi:hypothetical protein